MTATATIVILRTSTPCTVIAWFSGAIEAATSPRVSSRRSICSAIAWSTNAIAKVVTSITAGDAPRSGRKTARSIASERTTTTTKQAAMLQTTRPARREGERVGAGHDQLAVREVDEAQHAEDEADPDRHQRVDRAEPDRVDDRLGVDDCEDARAHPPK